MTVLGNAFPDFNVLSHWVSANLTMLFYFMAGWLIAEAIKIGFRRVNYKRLFTVLLAMFYVISVVGSYFRVEVPGMRILLSLSLFGFLLTKEAGRNVCLPGANAWCMPCHDTVMEYISVTSC